VSFERLVTAICGVALAVSLGCQGQPIPLTVAAGSTMLLPVSTGAYGSLIADSASPSRTDHQRGDLVVVICPASFNDTTCTRSGTTRFYLTTRYVASVWPDPASPAGIRGYLNFYGGALSGTGAPLAAQELAILEVPANVSPTNAEYYVSVRSRPHGSPQGQGETLAEDQPRRTIRVAPPAAAGFGFSDPTLIHAYAFGAGLDIGVTQDLQDLIPYPSVVVKLNLENNPLLFPAAGEIEVGYVSSLVRIKSVYEDRHLGRRSIVEWTDNGAGTLKILFIDPRRCTTSLRIAYDLVNGAQSGPVSLSAFSVNAAGSRSFDLDGVVQTGNPYVISSLSYAPANGCGPT